MRSVYKSVRPDTPNDLIRATSDTGLRYLVIDRIWDPVDTSHRAGLLLDELREVLRR